MRVFVPVLFLTLVLATCVSNAAPDTTKKFESSPFQIPEEEILATSTVPASPFRFQSGLAFSSGQLIEPNESSSQFSFAANFRQKKYGTGELDLFVTQSNLVGIFPGVRFEFGEDSIQRAYSKLSTGMYLVPDEGFVNFITIRRLQLRAALGFDNLLDLNHRLAAEVGVGASLVGAEIFTQIGWVWFL